MLSLNWKRFAKLFGTKQLEKCALTLQSDMFVTEKVKINKQNKSIVTGPLYVHTEFEAIRTHLLEDVAV